MKKSTIVLMLALILALTACNGNTASAQQANSNQTTNTPAELPLASKLVIGSFKLEGTGNAITAEQAAQLLPLWEVYVQLTSSDTAAQQEITALAQQIEETMTTEQMTAINAMNLTQQDVFTVMQEQGVQLSNRQQTQGSSSQQSGNNFGPPSGGSGEFVRPEGGGQGGGPGGGSGGFSGGQNISPEQIATAQARRSENGGGGGFQLNSTPSQLVEALIKLLQEKTNS